MPGSSALASTVASRGHRVPREPGLGQRRLDQPEHLVGRDTPAGADPDDQRRRPQHHGRASSIGSIRSVTTIRHWRRSGADGDRQRRQRPGGVGVQPDRLAVEQGPGDRGDLALDGPAEGVQAGHAGGVGGRGDHRLGASSVGDPLGAGRWPAAVAAEQGDREAARSSTQTTPGSVGLSRAAGRAAGRSRPVARKQTSSSHSAQARSQRLRPARRSCGCPATRSASRRRPAGLPRWRRSGRSSRADSVPVRAAGPATAQARRPGWSRRAGAPRRAAARAGAPAAARPRRR